MQAAAVHPRPIRFVLEVDSSQVGVLLQQLLTATTALAPHPTTPTPPAPADDEADPAPVRVPERDPPLQVASRPRVAARGGPRIGVRGGHQAPVPVVTLPPELRKYTLGRLCPKPGHEYLTSGRSLKRGTHCVECEKARNRARSQAHTAPPTPARPSLVPGASAPGSESSAAGERPALPSHLALTCFLSPITCQDPSHRYRETAYTLRFLDTEVCCQCVTQQSQTALAGD